MDFVAPSVQMVSHLPAFCHLSEHLGALVLNHLMNSMEEMETKLCSSDKEDTFKRELPYCIGEIDFTASGKKHGKVWALRSFNPLTPLLLFSCYFLAVNAETAIVRINVPRCEAPHCAPSRDHAFLNMNVV